LKLIIISPSLNAQVSERDHTRNAWARKYATEPWSPDNVSAAAVGHLEVRKEREPWQEAWSSSR
jgi:hypothetical protein